jgi:hypothetical protein
MGGQGVRRRSKATRDLSPARSGESRVTRLAPAFDAGDRDGNIDEAEILEEVMRAGWVVLAEKKRRREAAMRIRSPGHPAAA